MNLCAKLFLMAPMETPQNLDLMEAILSTNVFRRRTPALVGGNSAFHESRWRGAAVLFWKMGNEIM